ncbi:hypothetical protein JW898_01160 [Candidatus Woesearchaeota archaeon]|nr:hypothetical protein [Candidatus Woesearchaeota archaeon]
MGRCKKFRFPGRRLGKRAQEAESQLNWIFILIVGAVILAFFTFIVIKQRSASEAKFAGKVSQQLNTILVGAKVSSGTVQEIPTPDLEIRFTCNDYYIGPASQRLGNRILFAPGNIEGDRIITWTLDWNVPFKVTSFLYMTTPYVRYVVIGQSADDGEVKGIFDSLPQKLNKRMYSIGDYNAGLVRDEGDRFVRFIFVNVGTMFNIPEQFAQAEVSGLTVDTVNRQLQFLVRSTSNPGSFNTQGPKHTFIEDEVLYGAIFSDKAEDYECIMTRAYQRLNMVAKVYFEKLNEIAPVFKSTNCEGFYKDNPDIKELIDATKAYPPDYGLIGEVKTNLKNKNTNMQLQSCPLIY